MQNNKTAPSLKEADKANIAKQALLKIKELKDKLHDIEKAKHAPLAVIGMACDFPGGITSPEGYWSALLEGRDMIAPMSAARRKLLPVPLSEAADRPGGYVEDVDQFDAAFFGFSPREAERTDPQQRLFLKTAWKALEDAALNPDRLKGDRVGVYAGLTMHDYSDLISSYPDLYGIDGQDPAGTGGCFVSGRLSHALGVHGPSLTIDTACSSSLTAIHLATLALRTGDCKVAIVGGVNLVINPEMTATFAKAGMLSSNGRCNAFGDAADGFTRGEGCGVVILKPLDAALADGDPIRAVLYGTAVNQDGPSAGPTTPYGPAQCDLHRSVLADAASSAANVAYFETHGTGTALGDPIEYSALADVFGSEHSHDAPLYIGSVKSNFGHLEAAAGIAGFMKAALIAEHGRIPPSLHCDPASKHIDWDAHPIQVAKHAIDLPSLRSDHDDRVLIGVSSFGLSGTNAGAVLGPLQTANTTASANPMDAVPATLLLSAQSNVELQQEGQRWLSAFADGVGHDLTAVCRTSRLGRAHGPVKFSLTGTSRNDIRTGLERLVQHGPEASAEGGIAFLFSGQSTQYPYMGRELYQTEAVYRKVFDHCAESVADILPMSLHDIVFPAKDGLAETERLSHARLAQAALFATSTSLAELAKSYGVCPDVLVGHSIGEFSAAAQAGIMSIADGAKLAALRGQILSDIEPLGSMCAVFNLPQSVVEGVLAAQRSAAVISVFNGPKQFVLAGLEQELQTLAPILEAAGGKVVAMQMLQAYHTHFVADACAPFLQAIQKVELHAPHTPIFSTLLGARGDTAMLDYDYWSRQIASPVRFADAVRAVVAEKPFRLGLEMGPHSVLAPLTEAIIADVDEYMPPPHIAPTLVRGEPAQSTFQTALATASAANCSVKWAQSPDQGRRAAGMPGRNFVERSYWLRPIEGAQIASVAQNIGADPVAFAEAKAAPVLDTPEQIRTYVLSCVASVLHMDVGELDGVDDFYDVGLNSIHAIDASCLWEKQLGVKVDVGPLLSEPSLDGWCDALNLELANALSSAATVADENTSGNPEAVSHAGIALTGVQNAYWVGRNPQLPLGGVACYMYQEFSGGSVIAERFERAVRRLVQRHEMLRAVVNTDGYVEILPEDVSVSPEICDLRHCDPSDADAQLVARREAMQAKCADPAQWPLFELVLSLLPDGSSRVHLGLDMLIADAASVAILVQELDQLCANPECDLPVIGLGIAEAVRLMEDVQPRAASRDYWLNRLPQLPNGPALPLAQEPDNVSGHSFRRLNHTLSGAAWRRVKADCRQHKMTPTALLATLFTQVLARWSDSTHFCLTMTQFGRPAGRSGADRLVGDFTNLALLECDALPTESLEANVRAIMARLHADLSHRDFTALDLLRHAAEQTPGQVPNAPIVFTSALGVEGAEADLRFDCLGKWAWGLSQTPQVWLDHQLFEIDGELIIQWDFVETLFPENLVQSMFEAYTQLLENVVGLEADWSEKCAVDLPVRQRARRVEVNSTHTKYDAELLHSAIFDLGRQQPNAPAIITAESSHSYGDISAQAYRLAAVLQERGVHAGDRVAIRLPKSADQVISVLAVMLVGAVFVPLSEDWPRERCEVVLSSCSAAVIIANDNQSWSVVTVPPTATARSEFVAANPCQPSDPAYVIYTSGSTGTPKGVVVSHQAALNTILDVNQRLSVSAHDRVLALSALSFDLAVYDIFGLLRAGAALVLPNDAQRLEPEHWAHLVDVCGVTLWNTVPVLLDLYLSHLEAQNLSTPAQLRAGWLSGDWISLDLVARAARMAPTLRLIGSGGATEAGIWSNWYEISDLPADAPSVPYGKPLANQRYYVLDDDLNACPDWVSGNLYIAGDSLADAYFGDAEKTAASFITHPETHERLYATGDMGRYLPDGNLQFLGRLDSQVKIGGFRIELGDVNGALAKLPFVSKAVAFTLGEKENKSLAAAVIWQPEHTATAPILLDALRQTLPSYMVPSQVVEIDEFPLTANAKVDMAQLKSLAAQNVHVAPTLSAGMDNVAQAVCNLVKSQLGLQSLTLQDNLLALGATSVDIIRLASALKSDLGVTPQVNDLMRLTNVGALVEYCRPALTAQSGLEDQPTSRDVMGVVDILDRNPVLVEQQERSAFKLQVHNRRTDLDGLPQVNLPVADDLTGHMALQRYSCRDFVDEMIDFDAFNRWLSVLRPVLTDAGQKYAYGSAGGTYPVQTYLNIADNRIAGVAGGCYLLDLEQSALVRLDDTEVPFGDLSMSSRAWSEHCAFGVFFVCDFGAIAPIYGDVAVRFAFLEAGAMAHALEVSAIQCGLGLCQIGDVDAAPLRDKFQLHQDHYYLQAAIGGVPAAHFNAPQIISNQSLEHGEL